MESNSDYARSSSAEGARSDEYAGLAQHYSPLLVSKHPDLLSLHNVTHCVPLRRLLNALSCRHLIPHLAVQFWHMDDFAIDLHLLEEERRARGYTLVAQATEPFDVCRAALWARLTASDDLIEQAKRWAIRKPQ